MIVEASDFVKSPDEYGEYKFGVGDRKKIIDGLRKFLAAVVDGRALIQSVEVTSTASADEFVMQSLLFSYAEGPAMYDEEGKTINQKRQEVGLQPLQDDKSTADCTERFVNSGRFSEFPNPSIPK